MSTDEEPAARSTRSLGRRVAAFARRALYTVVAASAAYTAPWASRLWLERDAAALHAGDLDAERSVAMGAATWGPVDASHFDTGSELYDREWSFGTPMMRVACLAQVGLRHAPLGEQLGRELDTSAEALLARPARAFSVGRWGSDPLDASRLDDDHTAYLGYAGFALGLASALDPRWRGPRRELAQALRARLARAERRWLETYPGEVYPVDVASALGALAIDAKLEGRELEGDTAFHTALARLQSARDPVTGLFLQSIDPESGEARDGPRGSGTFLAAYFLLPVDASLSRSLYEDGARALYGTTLGFSAMRERPSGDPGAGDIDSGPVILGYGVSASGFAMGPARSFGDHERFAGLYATAELFGVPQRSERHGHRHLTGGPLGDAVLCAMQTAPTPAELAHFLGDPR